MKTIYAKKIHEIFSETKIKSPIKTKIIVDYREKNSLVISALINLGFEIDLRELKVADYIVNNIAIERKTISDFIQSLINKRLVKQLQEMHQYKNKLLLIEGLDEQELYPEKGRVHPNAIRGFLLSILLKYNIPIIFSKNYEDTAKFIDILAKKKNIESSLNVNKKTLNKQERLQFILESFPGIGPKNAKKLLKKFKTLKKIIDSPINEIEKVIGKKAEVFKLINEDFCNDA